MSADSERNIRDARAVEAALRREGRAFEADAIGRICRALASATETASRLWHDNAALRAAAREGEGQDGGAA